VLAKHWLHGPGVNFREAAEIAHLGTADFVAGKETMIFLGTRGTGQPSGDRAAIPVASRPPGVYHR
jgi:hypothetical protein